MIAEVADKLADYSIFLILSIWAGIAKYMGKLLQNKTLKFSFKYLMYDVVISSFVGVVAMFICVWQGLSMAESAIVIALTAHMGTRAIILGEMFLTDTFRRLTNGKSNDKTKS